MVGSGPPPTLNPLVAPGDSPSGSPSERPTRPRLYQFRFHMGILLPMSPLGLPESTIKLPGFPIGLPQSPIGPPEFPIGLPLSPIVGCPLSGLNLVSSRRYFFLFTIIILASSIGIGTLQDDWNYFRYFWPIYGENERKQNKRKLY